MGAVFRGKGDNKETNRALKNFAVVVGTGKELLHNQGRAILG